jgi:hypothetical protein
MTWGEDSGKHALKDNTKPDGDACRPNGMLKDVSKIEWVHSPSALNMEEPRESTNTLKRKLSVKETELEYEKLLKVKVSH